MAQTTTQPTETSIAEATAQNLPAPRARTAINPIVPQTWQEVVTIASAICRAGMAPKSYYKVDGYGKPVYVDGKPVADPEKVAIAIMHGMEVGLTPMASLQSLAVINGMPSVYGDGLLALIRASGLLENIEETIEWAKDGPLAATCTMWRKGEKTPSVQTYTRADAQKARLWGKPGPWTDHPARMLQWRARGWCGRDKFADVLRGLHSAEEAEEMVDITSRGTAETTHAPAEPQRSDYQPAAAEPTKAEPESQPDASASLATPAESGQPGGCSPGAGGDSKPEAASTPASNQARAPHNETVETRPDDKPTVTDVVDQNEQEQEAAPQTDAPVVSFVEYKKVGDFFDFADVWLQAETRTEAELVAFSAFYHQFMVDRLSPSWKSAAIRDAMTETKAFLDAAMKRAQAKAKAALK